MKRFLLGGFLLTALLPCSTATARPAECLVVIEGRNLMDGPCDFQSEAGGDFTVTQGSRTAKVTVDPGSREGRAFFQDTSPRNPQSLVWDVRRQGACWVDGTSRICAWSVGQRPQAQAPMPMPQRPMPQQPMPQQQAAARMIRMDTPPGRFTLAREMRGNRLLRCVVFGPEDEGLWVSYIPGTTLRRTLSLPGNQEPDGTDDTLTVRLHGAGARDVTLAGRHADGRVTASLPDDFFDGFSQATGMDVQFASTGETRSIDLTTFSEVEPAVDGCLTSFGPSQDDMMREAERAHQRETARNPRQQPPAPAPQRQGEPFRFDFTRAGVWDIRRLSDEPSGRRTRGCIVDSTDPVSNNLRFAVDSRNAIIEFRDGSDLAGLPPRFQVQIQFGTNTRSYSFPAEIIDEGYGPWVRLMTQRNFQSGIENADQLIIRTPNGRVALPLLDGDTLWPAMARCMAMIR